MRAADPLLPAMGDLPVNSIYVRFSFLWIHFDIHRLFLVVIVTNSEFQSNLDPSPRAFLNESLMNFGILVLIIDLCSARSFDFQGLHEIFNLISEPPRLQSKIPGRRFGGIEMLMKPFCRRDEQRARPPVDPRPRFSWLPQ